MNPPFRHAHGKTVDNCEARLLGSIMMRITRSQLAKYAKDGTLQSAY